MFGRRILFCTFIFFFSTILYAQDSFTVSGGNCDGSGGSISFSFGQLLFGFNEGFSESETEGVQQPYEISNNELDSSIKKEMSIELFPNPTFDKLYIKLGNFDFNNCKVFLCDLEGKMIKRIIPTANDFFIPMGDVMPALYFVCLLKNDILISNYKVIKK